MQDLDGEYTSAFDCADSLLVTGTDEGAVTVTSLVDGSCISKFRHGSGGGGSGAGDRYRGITSLFCIQEPCWVHTSNGGGAGGVEGSGAAGAGGCTQLLFSGCSQGMIKVWAVARNSAGTTSAAAGGGKGGRVEGGGGGGEGGNNDDDADNGDGSGRAGGRGRSGVINALSFTQRYFGVRMNLRFKQSLAVVKMHSAPITAMTARTHDCSSTGSSHTASSWLLASGDKTGKVAIVRGSANSSATVQISAAIRPPTAAHGGGAAGVAAAPAGGGGSGGGLSSHGFGSHRRRSVTAGTSTHGHAHGHAHGYGHAHGGHGNAGNVPNTGCLSLSGSSTSVSCLAFVGAPVHPMDAFQHQHTGSQSI